MIARGISVTPDVVVVAFGLAALILGRGKLFLRDWIPFLALFFAYELMRGYADKFGLPIHVTDIVSLERVIGLGGLPTTWLQGLFHSGPVWTQANPVTTTWPPSRLSSTSCTSRCRWPSASCSGSTSGASTTTTWRP